MSQYITIDDRAHRSRIFLTKDYSGEELVHFAHNRIQSIFMSIDLHQSGEPFRNRLIEVDGKQYDVEFYIDQEEVPGSHLTPNLNPYFITDDEGTNRDTWDQYGMCYRSFQCCGKSVDEYVDDYFAQPHLIETMVRTMVEKNAIIYRFPSVFPNSGCCKLKECSPCLNEAYHWYYSSPY